MKHCILQCNRLLLLFSFLKPKSQLFLSTLLSSLNTRFFSLTTEHLQTHITFGNLHLHLYFTKPWQTKNTKKNSFLHTYLLSSMGVKTRMGGQASRQNIVAPVWFACLSFHNVFSLLSAGFTIVLWPVLISKPLAYERA